MASAILFLTQIRLFDVMEAGLSNQKMFFYGLLTSWWPLFLYQSSFFDLAV